MNEPGGAVSWAADIASIGSLGVSGYVAWQVRGIKTRFIRRFAISIFIEQLRAHKITLTGFFKSSAADNVELVAEMARCEANLSSAARHLDRMASRDAREALRLIKAGRAANLYAIYAAVVRLLQTLENAAAEQEVSSYVE